MRRAPGSIGIRRASTARGTLSPSPPGGGRWARRGLAPLELILCLPFLLVILALIINIGIETKWKLRALAVSRQVVWRQRGFRNGGQDPRPAGWRPPQATYSVIPNPPPPLFPQDPLAQHAVTRGPVLRNPMVDTPESQLLVDTGMLDIAGSMEMGVARVDRGFPIFPKLPGVHLRVDHLLIDSQWRFWEMHSMGDESRRFWTNEDRRAFLFYGFTPPESVANAALKYQQTTQAIFSAPWRRKLDVLDNDDELIAWWGPPAPDFHPRLPVPDCRGLMCTYCTLDLFKVWNDEVSVLVKLIQGSNGEGKDGVPDRVADAFIRMYNEQIAVLNGQMPKNEPEIQRLAELVHLLEKFKKLNSLRGQ